VPSTFSATAAHPRARTKATPSAPKQSCAPFTCRLRRSHQGWCRLDHGVVPSRWNGFPMHANKHLITDVLKGELGFEGFVSATGSHRQPPGLERRQDRGSHQRRPRHGHGAAQLSLVRLRSAPFGQEGPRTMARIDDAFAGILKQKARFKLWEHPFASAIFRPARLARHRALAREAVRQSAVLLQNRTPCCHCPRTVASLWWAARPTTWASSAADGPWVVGQAWQTSRPGTTILRAIEKAAPAGKVSFAPA